MGGFNTFGYADEVVLPIEVSLEVPGSPLKASLQLVYGVCRDICVLGEAELALDIPQGSSGRTPHHDLIEWFNRQVPTTLSDAVDISSARVVNANDGQIIQIEAVAKDGPGFSEPDILVEGLEEISLPRARDNCRPEPAQDHG